MYYNVNVYWVLLVILSTKKTLQFTTFFLLARNIISSGSNRLAAGKQEVNHMQGYRLLWIFRVPFWKIARRSPGLFLEKKKDLEMFLIPHLWILKDAFVSVHLSIHHPSLHHNFKIFNFFDANWNEELMGLRSTNKSILV